MTSASPSLDADRPDGRFWRSKSFQSWLKRRMPPSRAITLDQQKIFILPTGEGMFFVLLILFMMVGAINYQNSLIFGFAFLLGSFFMVSIFHTYRNLSGLTIAAGSARPAFAGEDVEFTVILSRHGERTYEAINLGWPDALLQSADLVTPTELKVRLFTMSETRGHLRPGRLLIQSCFPVGLFRAWSWVDLDMTAIIYPRPVFAGAVPPALNATSEGELLHRQGVDDFYGLKQYQAGDSLRQIAWKSFARTDELLTKEFAAFVDRRVWLDWNYFTGIDKEQRLSRLCYWTVQLSKTTDEYGLRLPGLEIPPSRGAEHREKVLKALALFDLGHEAS